MYSSYYEKIGNKVVCINEEIPFELPANWMFVRLKSIWQLLSGRDLAPSEYNSSNDGIPYITGASNFSNGSVIINRWTTSPQVISETGDLLLTCKGTVGEIAFNDFGNAHIARQIMAIRNVCNLDSEYMELCIRYYLDLLITNAKGLIPGISREDILNLILPIPPQKYQTRMVLQMKEIHKVLNSVLECIN
ncbi:MAG: restriction endonuclease subunit S [Gemmiger sp.]|nr:restriction endonuclease subunit S [Gemmiger sp.]